MSHFTTDSNSWSNWKYPIMRNKVGSNTYTYSPLVYGVNENGTNVLKSPWSADLVVRPDRGLKVDNVWGEDWDSTNPSQWEYYLSNLRMDTKLKVISAYTKDDTAYYANWNCGSGYIDLQPWAQQYYTGLEYDSSEPTQTNGKNAGVFWNLNTLSSRTNNFKDVSYKVLGIVSLHKKLLQPITNVSHTYTGMAIGTGHYYNTVFGFDPSDVVSRISVTGNLDPFNYRLYVSFKGGHQVFQPLYEGGQSVLHVGSDHDRGFTAASAFSFKTPLLSSIIAESNTAQAARLSPQSGIVKHFNIQGSNYDYFLIDISNAPLSSMFQQYNVLSGISSPIISLTVNHNSGSTQEDAYKYATSGLVWKNATATAQTVLGATARVTGNLHLAPFINGTFDFLKNDAGFTTAQLEYKIMDMSFGFSAKQGT